MSNTPIHNPHLIYRPDIDGLRAVAIVLVIVFHAFPKLLRGGFIGVDIFFVISGYLITSIILKELARGSFSLIEFYSRRIKRIFPALIVVLSFCLIAGWYVLLANEYEVLGKHIAAGSIYISNFILQGEAGYFDTDAELKPLLHLWSLAVEEQFYLFFPLLLMLSHKLRINALGVIVVAFAVSFAFNISQIVDKPTEVFFFPQARIWELLIGSTVAYISLRTHFLKRKTQKMSNLLAIFGVSLIIFAWIYLDNKKIFFPYFWALLPTIGTACLIIAGEKAWFNRQVLASKFAIFIGLISYPLYLWHWVLLSFLQITEIDKPKFLLKLLLLVLSAFLAWLTYFFIEKNIRFIKSNFVSLFLLTALLLVGVAGYIVYDNKGYSDRFNFEKNWIEGDIGSQLYSKKGFRFNNECVEKYVSDLDNEVTETQFCLIENINIDPTAMLIGDSHANHLYWGLIKNKELTGGNLLNRGANSCFPFFDNPSTANDVCPILIDSLLKEAKENSSIKTIILSGRLINEKNEKNFIPKNSVLTKENDPYLIFQNGMRKTLQFLTVTNKKIMFILDTPDLEFDPVQCLNRPWRLDESNIKHLCAVPRSLVNLHRKKYIDIVTPILNEFPDVKILDPLPALCDDNYCWAIRDQKLLYRNHDHLNKTGGEYVGDYFKSIMN